MAFLRPMGLRPRPAALGSYASAPDYQGTYTLGLHSYASASCYLTYQQTHPSFDIIHYG